MTRILDNEIIEERFSVTDYLPTAEEMYRELGRQRAATTPRQTTVSHAEEPREEAVEPAFHVMRTMGGSIKSFGVAAMRLNSDVKHWPERHGRPVQERVPNVDDRYNGLVFLFSTDTGELLMVFPDGLVQTYHVAGGIAMGAKHLAPDDATKLGMYGTGHQARTHIRALDEVLDLGEITVYSPTREHRETFAAEMNERVTPTVSATDTPRDVCTGADVINCATNSTEAVFEADWVEPGTHIGFIRPNEIPNELWERSMCDSFSISTANQPVEESSVASGYITEDDEAADPWRWFVRGDDPPYPKTAPRSREPEPIDGEEFVRLPDIMVDDSLGRMNPDDVTVFAQRGDGIAFAGIGYALYELAESEDLGETLPTEMFTQTYVP